MFALHATSSAVVSPVELLACPEALSTGSKAELFSWLYSISPNHPRQADPANWLSRASLGRYSPRPFSSPQTRTMLNIHGTVFLINPHTSAPGIPGRSSKIMTIPELSAEPQHCTTH